jgi:hypothetical protein
VDSALKAAGMVAGLGVAGILGVIGYRLATDDWMAWAVVVGLMLCVVIAAATIAARAWAHMYTARTNMLREQRNADLTGARTWALTKDMTGGGGSLAALMASIPPGDVVDMPAHATWGEPGGAFTQGGEE